MPISQTDIMDRLLPLLRELSPPPEPVDPDPSDKTSRHIYFGVPLSSDTAKDGFSGQYLRLEEYVGPQEDPHLPTSLSKDELKGIAISSTGCFLMNVAVGVHETYGKALTEAISGKDHTITIEKDDWTLVAEKGEISIETTNTGAVGKMSFVSTDSDIVFTALNGKASTSDRFDVKTSTSNTVTFIVGFEYSAVAGMVIKQNVGFVMNINVARELQVKLSDIKVEAFPFKFGVSSFSIGIWAQKFQLIAAKFGIIDAKKMIVYNKINQFQIYNEIAKDESSLIKNDITLTNMTQKLAAAETVAADCSMWQLLKM